MRRTDEDLQDAFSFVLDPEDDHSPCLVGREDPACSAREWTFRVRMGEGSVTEGQAHSTTNSKQSAV